MWDGPWERWKYVPRVHRDRLFRRFQGYFQWENHWEAQIYSCWERTNAKKVTGLLKRARKGAIAMATKKSLKVGDDFSVLLEFKPPWMRTVHWNELIEIWNTPSWKAKSFRNTQNRAKSTCRHTLGSQSFVTAKLRADKKLGRQITFEEMWKQSHCKKGSRPLDRVHEGSSSVVDGLGEDCELEENVQEDIEWVDDRSRQTYEKYESYIVDNHEEDLQCPYFNEDLWSEASGGKNKGKLYGFNNVDDPSALITGIPSTSCRGTSYENGRQDPEIQRLKGIIDGLVAEKEMEKAEKEREKAEKEKEKAEKKVMHERLTNIEAMLKLMTQNLLSSS